ncbi:MAG: HEAT repeat domain-containing protein [bacterium]
MLNIYPDNDIMNNESNVLKMELREVGIIIDDIYDFVNTPQPYPEAIPILINALKKELSDKILIEGIVRSLAVKEARGLCNKVLIKEFYRIPKENTFLLWAIGNTMAVVVCQEDVDDIIEIIKKKEYGASRQMFVYALKRVNAEKAEDLLIDLLDDTDVVSHVIGVLGKMKSQKAKSKITELLSDKNSFVRKQAAKALKKIG